MKEESLLLLSDLQKLINQVVLIDYTIIILGGYMTLQEYEQQGGCVGCQFYEAIDTDGRLGCTFN